MAYTNVENLDDALAVLNGAHRAFRPDFCQITRDDDGRGITVDWGGGYATREINGATTVVYRAMMTVNGAMKADPALRLVVDHKGWWVAIRAA
ncbi:hypothetical protein [Rhodobacter capsulatus]|jgi:hypothetical protein|uniref:Uncharacterized protein n=1 Tax=Rhodobacter capsulatus (strain ATCC BAA-309 / NBRC 16581 / SB1003) TaxID=272942 RepID=D5AML9_RHOCB|nr:hypothetical protein [Rhodobacter capsulatus]ADE86295.1 hypothetical protein RCAP_rcc02565 [Rhodobacter capsulatus SB 1003]ETD00952.1 hypothetical protein U714_14200 [Rhodobacter capsulatus DE442]ETD75455.1 hypothetical protein U717_14360 [Rhodobacter capsulatus R121]ETE52988.1 hypothetical protein U715_14355 [Rhodobacter capsulatus Y262]MDS0928106.1 hypothetical protein [Rhodobacter capsulatus]